MKKIILYITVFALMFCMGTVAVCATEAEITELSTELSTEFESGADTETDAIIDPEAASEIIDIIESTDNRSDVILAIVTKYGCTPEEAEEILNTFIALGDKYLGENATWVGFKKDVQENTKFWVTAITCGVAALALLVGALVLLGKTNPTMRRAMFGMADALKMSEQQVQVNSQTLEKMEKLFAEAMEKEEYFEKTISEKDEQIIALSKHIKTLKTAIKKERSNMLFAEMYNLRMLKLICDRMTMPVADKSTIDHWYAKGIEAIKKELSAEDIEKADAMLDMLDITGGCDG